MSGRGGIAGNPVLIGAATILVVLVAVFLAYNANQGLPFVPTYQLRAEVPSAANLVVGNDVRIGGSRVGFVDGIEAERQDDGSTIAVLDLTLERDVAPLPRDSTLIVRPRSALGLKFVEITRGTDSEGFDEGATIPIEAATPAPVEFDEVLSMFDEATRDAAAANTRGFGDAFAGRGESINTAIGAFRPLLRDVVPVAQNLSSPETNLRRFFGELGDAAAIVAPAAEAQAELFVNLDTTFGALREVARPYIQESITEGVPALETAIRTLPVQRPFLRNTEALFRELRPGAAALRTSAPTIADALEVGTRVLPRTPPFNRRLASLLDELQTFAEDPQVPLGPGRHHRHAPVAGADAGVHHARPDRLQLPDAVLPQRLVAAQRRRPQRHLAALHHRRHAAGARTTRAARPRRRPTGRPRTTTCTPTRTRTRRPPASRASARRATSRSCAGQTVLTNPQRHPAGAHGGQPLMGRRKPRNPVADRRDRPGRDRRARLPRLDQGHPVHAARTRSTPSSSRPTRSGPDRRSGSRASTSARSRRSTADEDTDAAVVVLQIDDDGLPLHEDATAKIRPRIFLEGNFFVDLKPGSPSAPELEDGGTIEVTQTATPVQLDQVLTSLQSDTRQDLKDVLNVLAVALTSEPTAAEDRAADPLDARRDGRRVVQRRLRRHSRGRAHDGDRARLLARHRAGPRPVAPDRRHRAHDRRADPQRERAARPDHELQHDHGGLRRRVRQPAALDRASFRSRSRPPTARSRRSTRRSRPRARGRRRSSPASARRRPRSTAALPWIAQARPLMGPKELGGVAKELAPGQP